MPKDLMNDLSNENTEMNDVGNKRGREENGEEQGQAKRSSTPVHEVLQDANKGAATEKVQALGEQEDEKMQDEL